MNDRTCMAHGRSAAFAVVVGAFLLPAHGFSGDFTALRNEVDAEYLRPRGMQIGDVEHTQPMLLSGALGHALRHQYLMARSDPARTDYLRRTVEPEFQSYFGWLANRYRAFPGYRGPDGRPVGGQQLLQNFRGALDGKDDAYFAQAFGIAHTAPQSPYAAAPGQPPPAGAPSWGFRLNEPAPTPPPPGSIDLLGQKAPAANIPGVVPREPGAPVKPQPGTQ